MAASSPTPFGLTIRDALTAAHDQGYETQFIVGDDAQIVSVDSVYSAHANEVDVNILWRIEGTSDSADQIVVAAIVTPENGRGTLLLTYGPSAADDDNRVMEALDVRNAKPGLPPETPSA